MDTESFTPPFSVNLGADADTAQYGGIEVRFIKPVTPGLTRQLCLSGRCGEGLLLSDDGIEGCEQLSGGGDDGDLGGFSGLDQASMEGGERR